MKTAMLITMAAVFAVTLAACAGGMGEAMNTPKPSALPSPSASPTMSAEPSGSPDVSPSAGASADPSGSPEASEDVVSTAGTGSVTGMIDGFMEGAVIDPSEVPDLVRLLASRDEYKDMSIQSITYKMFQDRQAYYVILQGEGEASHPLYVFADDTIMAEDTDNR